MNVAFPALLLFILVLPGFICRSAYYDTEQKELNNQPFSVEGTISFILSIFLHLVWMGLASLLFEHHANLNHVLALLSHSSERAIDAALLNASANVYPISAYFLSLYVASWIIGVCAQKIVKDMGLNVKFPFIFSFNTPWQYQFKGLAYVTETKKNGKTIKKLKSLVGKNAFVMVTCAVTRPDDTYLYCGILDDFFLKKDGSLDRIVLGLTIRRKISDDENPALFYQIPGDKIIIKYEDMSSINIDYKSIPEKNGIVQVAQAA